MRTHARARSAHPLSFVLPALLLALPAAAGTPDDVTPANEGICDELHEASPGLFGLCVAYCEAQDCDSVGTALSAQCSAPSPRVLAQYERKRQADDPPMPCVAPSACPCFSAEELADLPSEMCLEGEGIVALGDGSLSSGAMVQTDASGGGVCAFVDVTGDPLEALSTQFVVDAEEAAACAALIHEHIETLGLTCEVPAPGPR